VGHVEEFNLQGFRRAGLHAKIHPGGKLTVLTKNAKSGIAVSGWTYSLRCVCICLYQISQTMHSFLKEGGNDVFAHGNKSTLIKCNKNIEQRGPLGKTLPQKTKTTLPVLSQQCCPFSINIYYYKPDGYYYLSTNGNELPQGPYKFTSPS
jgi:hypothetical protein